MKWVDLRYLLQWIYIVPLLPLLYFQGKRLRRVITELPEANHPEGKCFVEADVPTDHIIFLGESTIAGLGVENHVDGFAGHFASAWSQKRRVNVHWNVVARSGYTAHRVADKLFKHLPSTPAQVVVIGLGGNDTFQLTPTWKWRRDIKQVIQKVKKRYPDSILAFTQMPPIRLFPAFSPVMKWVFGRQVDLLATSLKQVLVHYPDVYFNPSRITIKGWKKYHPQLKSLNELFSDGVHPSGLTYRIWGRVTAGELLERFLTSPVREQN